MAFGSPWIWPPEILADGHRAVGGVPVVRPSSGWDGRVCSVPNLEEDTSLCCPRRRLWKFWSCSI